MILLDKLRKNQFWASVMQLSLGQIMGQVINLLCVPILARIYFNEDYGQLGVIVSLSTIITGITCLGINSSMMLAEDDEGARTAFHVSQNIQILLAAITAILLFVISHWVSVINTDIPKALAFFLIFLYISINARNSLLSVYLNRLGMNKILLITPMVNAGANLLVALPLGLLGFKYYGLIISAISALFVSNIIMAKHARISFRIVSLSECKGILYKYRELVKYQYPSNLVTSLSTQCPNQILSNCFGNNSLGDYSMCDKIFHIPFTMIATPIQTIYFRTASKMADQQHKLSDFTYSMVSKILYVAFIPIIIMVIWGENIFSFVLGESWGTAGELASILIIPYVFSFVNNCITYCRVSIGKARINLYTSIANLVLILISISAGAFVVKSLYCTILFYSAANTLYGAANIYITFKCLGYNSKKYAILSLIYLLVCCLFLAIKQVIL